MLLKKKKVVEYITDEIEIYSDDSSTEDSNEENSDKKNSDEENSNEIN